MRFGESGQGQAGIVPPSDCPIFRAEVRASKRRAADGEGDGWWAW